MEQPPAGYFFAEKGFPPYSFSFFFRPVLFLFLCLKRKKKVRVAAANAAPSPTWKCGVFSFFKTSLSRSSGFEREKEDHRSGILNGKSGEVLSFSKTG
jgi:hypothetical protein